MKELHSLGFREASRCEEALRLSGGEVKGALSLLQRPLLEPFHQRIWTDQPEPPIDPQHPDKQVCSQQRRNRKSNASRLRTRGVKDGYLQLHPLVPRLHPFVLLGFLTVCLCCLLASSRLPSEDMQASAGALRAAQLGPLRAGPLAAAGAGRHLLAGGRGAGREGVARQGLHQAPPHQRVPLLPEPLPPQQGGGAPHHTVLRMKRRIRIRT